VPADAITMAMNKRGMRRPSASLDGEEWAELAGLQKASMDFPLRRLLGEQSGSSKALSAGIEETK
jgi:hypothetical protein